MPKLSFLVDYLNSDESLVIVMIDAKKLRFSSGDHKARPLFSGPSVGVLTFITSRRKNQGKREELRMIVGFLAWVIVVC